jgi:N-acetylglucosamine kinase-like BadF-type ATPase
MCGTGSVAVGDTKNSRKYSGGWGPVYGDGGSGGGMGSDALRIFLRSIDTNKDIGKLASLFGHLKEGLDISTFEGRMELKDRAINMSRRELASLAPMIYGLAESGDAVSCALYESAASEIADLAYGVSDDSSDFKVLLCGGFFANKPMLLEATERLFSKKSRATLVYEPRFSPIVAAQIAVLRENGAQITDKVFDKILN